MHLMDPIKVHVSYTCVCVCVCVCGVLNEVLTLHRFSVHNSAVFWSCTVVNVGRHINQAWEVHVSTVVQLIMY